MPDVDDQAQVGQSDDTATEGASYPETVDLKIGGEEKAVPWDEVITLAQQGGDYTQKTQGLAQLRSDYEQRMQQYEGAYSQLQEHQQRIQQQEQAVQQYAQQVEQWASQMGYYNQQQQMGQDQYGQPPVGQQPHPQQMPPQVPQYQPPQGPEQNPSDQRLQELEARLESKDLQWEIQRLGQEYPAVQDPLFQTVLLTDAVRQSGLPLREVAQQVQQAVQQHDNQVIERYLAAKQEANVGPGPMSGGVPVTPKPMPLARDDHLEADLRTMISSAMDQPIPIQ